MPSDLATSQRGARREGGGGWAARVHNLVAGGLKVGKEGGIGVEGEVGVEGSAEGGEEAGSGGGLKDGGVGWGRGGLGGLVGACRQYGGGSSAGLKSEERVEVEAEGFRAKSTCLGLQVVQRAGFRQRNEKA
jgi:hypothetical protein